MSTTSSFADCDQEVGGGGLIGLLPDGVQDALGQLLSDTCRASLRQTCRELRAMVDKYAPVCSVNFNVPPSMCIGDVVTLVSGARRLLSTAQRLTVFATDEERLCAFLQAALPAAERLTHLDLSHSVFCEAVATALSTTASSAHLTHLSLPYCDGQAMTGFPALTPPASSSNSSPVPVGVAAVAQGGEEGVNGANDDGGDEYHDATDDIDGKDSVGDGGGDDDADSSSDGDDDSDGAEDDDDDGSWDEPGPSNTARTANRPTAAQLRTLASVAPLCNVTTLSLSLWEPQPGHLTAVLSRLPSLTHVAFNEAGLGRDRFSLRPLAAVPRLRSLSLNAFHGNLAELAALSGLEHLTVNNHDADDYELDMAEVMWHQPTPATRLCLTTLTALTSLRLASLSQLDEMYVVPAAHHHLRVVELSVPVNVAVLRTLSELPVLSGLTATYLDLQKVPDVQLSDGADLGTGVCLAALTRLVVHNVLAVSAGTLAGVFPHLCELAMGDVLDAGVAGMRQYAAFMAAVPATLRSVAVRNNCAAQLAPTLSGLGSACRALSLRPRRLDLPELGKALGGGAYDALAALAGRKRPDGRHGGPILFGFFQGIPTADPPSHDGLPNVAELVLDGSADVERGGAVLDDEALRVILQTVSPKLARLVLREAAVRAEVLDAVLKGRLPALRCIELHGCCNISAAGAASLASHPSLHEFVIVNCRNPHVGGKALCAADVCPLVDHATRPWLSVSVTQKAREGL